jgi:hypothetical protein
MDGRQLGKPLPPKTVEVVKRLYEYTPTVWTHHGHGCFEKASRVYADVARLPCPCCLAQVPDELVQHLLRRSGEDCNDQQL